MEILMKPNFKSNVAQKGFEWLCSVIGFIKLYGSLVMVRVNCL